MTAVLNACLVMGFFVLSITDALNSLLRKVGVQVSL